MRPQVIGWVLADGLFEHLEETTSNLVLRERVGLSGDELVGSCIVTSLRTAHLHIEYGIVHLSHDSLATRKYWGLGMIEEG